MIRFRSILCFLAIVFAICTNTDAQIAGEFVFTETPPVIDGVVDEAAWANSPSYTDFFTTADADPDNEADLFATWQGAWDLDNLYIYTFVVDDALIGMDSNDWQDDSIEFYIDAGGLGQGEEPSVVDYGPAGDPGPNGTPVYQLTFLVDEEEIHNGVNHLEWVDRFGNEINADGWLVDEGSFYSFETAIPWSSLGATAADVLANDGTFGFGLAVNDDDDLGGRDSQISWATDSPDLWQNATEFPTVALTFPDPEPTTCDFDASTTCDLDDIDMLMTEVGNGTNDASFDLTNDGLVDDADRDAWLAAAATENELSAPYLLGDSNLDLRVNAEDLNAVGISWQTANNKWSEGNFTGGGVDASDLNEVGINWQMTHPDAPAGGQAVPEPVTHFLLTTAALMGLCLRRRRRN